MVPMNPYLVTRSGRPIGSRALVGVLSFGSFIVGPVVGVAGGVIGGALDVAAISVLAVLAGIAIFFGGIVLAWVLLLTGAKKAGQAMDAWRAGYFPRAVELSQSALRTVFRADVRTRALYVLGLCAESRADFAAAADLFARSSEAMPAMAAGKYQRQARCLMHAHRAVALVADRRLDEADASVRLASALFPALPPGALDVLTDDAGVGAVGVSTAIRDIEIGRDPRALLTLASALVLSARGMAREALELVERERYTLNAAMLPPRERALVANIETRARRLLGGGPMRAPGHDHAGQGAADPWAERVLPSHA